MQITFEAETEFASQRLRQIQNRIPEARQSLVRQVAQLVLTRVAERNPVDTGRSRAAWIAAGQALGLNWVGSWDSLEDQTEAAALQEGLQSGTGSLQEESHRTTYAATNQVDYVPILEYGSSRQAPSAMVRSSLSQTAPEVRALLPSFLSPLLH